MKHTAAVLIVALAATLAACGGEDSAEPVTDTACARVLYEGEGRPDLIVVSNLPRRGPEEEVVKTIEFMNDAIELVLRKRNFRAGEYRIGFQACDDTVGGEPDAARCRQNARAYVATKDVVGVIGPYISGCATLQIPIVSRKAAGPLAMISPSATSLALTRVPPGADPGPSLYPQPGVRSFFRVVTYDAAQGIAAAHFARRTGAQRVAVVHQDLDFDEQYARGLVVPFRAAAQALGLEVALFDWTLRESYARLAARVAAAQPDAVYVVGLPQENAKRLVEDLRRALPGVPFVAPDSFAATDIMRELGPAGEGMFVTVPGVPAEALPPAGKRFVAELGVTFVLVGGQGAPEAAQAAIVLLDAIARSDGSRASVVDELFRTKVTNGILGSFSFDRYGDIVPAPVGVYRFQGGDFVVAAVIRAPLDAFRG